MIVQPRRRYALTISATYFVLTCMWIYFSSQLIVWMANGNIETLARLQRFKGFGFMTVTAVALYFGVMRIMRAGIALQDSQDRWMEAERKAAPALLASCIAHDVANLLTVIRLNLERVKRLDVQPIVAEAFARMDSGTDRLTELVKRLRGASTPLFHDHPPTFDFTKITQETLTLMEPHTCCENTKIELLGEPSPIVGYPVLVHQLVMNLLINAAQATSRRGHVRFTVSALDIGVADGASGGVIIVCEDDGPGIAMGLREKVMSAFFTTKTTGSGLGLTSVRSCVDIHQGQMEIGDSADLGGAKFTITLPNLTSERVEELRHPNRTVRAQQVALDQLQA